MANDMEPAPHWRAFLRDRAAAAVGENRRTFDKARTLLLAAAGGEPSDAPALCKHAAQDRGAAIARGIGDPQGGADFGDAGGWREVRTVGGIDWKNGIFGCFGVNVRQNWPVAARYKAPGRKPRRERCVCGLPCVGASLNHGSKWKSRPSSSTVQAKQSGLEQPAPRSRA